MVLMVIRNTFKFDLGAYARATKQCTKFGGYLDIIVDFTVNL